MRTSNELIMVADMLVVVRDGDDACISCEATSGRRKSAASERERLLLLHDGAGDTRQRGLTSDGMGVRANQIVCIYFIINIYYSRRFEITPILENFIQYYDLSPRVINN